MKKKQWKTSQIVLLCVALVSSVVAILALYLWAQPCNGVLELANGNAVPMRCLYTTKVAVLLFLMLSIATVATLLLKVDLRIALILFALAAAVITFESFVGIGVCKSEMACWTTAFWIRTSSGVTIVCVLASYLFGKKRQV